MLKKSSPLKHKKGDAMVHAPYATEEAYHQKHGGEVDDGLDANDINPSLPPLIDPTPSGVDPNAPINDREEILDAASEQRQQIKAQNKANKNLKVTGSKPLLDDLSFMEKYDTEEAQEEAENEVNDEIVNVFGGWDDETNQFEKGSLLKKKDEVEETVNSFGGFAQALDAQINRAQNESSNTASQGRTTFQPIIIEGEDESTAVSSTDRKEEDALDLVGKDLFNDAETAHLRGNIKVNVLDASLKNVSIQDFAAKNKIKVNDVDTNSDEFKEFQYTREDLVKNKELYDRVVNQDYKKTAANIDIIDKKTEALRKEYDNRYDKSKPWYKDLYIGKDQKQLEKQAEKHLKHYQPILESIIKSSTDMGNRIEDLSINVRKDYEWLTENNPEARLKELIEKKYTSQEEADAANEEYKRIIEDYNKVLNRMQTNIGSMDAYRTTLNNGLESARAIEGKVENLSIIKDLSGDNYGELHNLSSRAVAATAEFLIGADEFTKRYNPWLALNPKDVPEIFKPVVEHMQSRSLLNGTFGATQLITGNKENNALRKSLDGLSTYLRDKQTSYENHNWATRTVMDMAEMTPQILTGMVPGVGLLGNYSIMAATSTGNSFLRFEEEGLTGWDLYATSTFHGGMEGVSEMVTSKLGSRALKNFANPNNFIKGGVRNYTKNLFGFGAYTTEEAGIEGLSEGFNTWSTNMYDKAVRGKQISLWDGVAESFWKGASVSVGFKGPMITKSIYRPFIPKSTNVQLGQIADRIKEVDALLADPNISLESFEKLSNEQKMLVEKSNKIYDKAITTTASIDPKERQELIDIEVQGYNIKRDYNEVLNNEDMSKQEKQKTIDQLNSQYHELAKNKKDILDKYDNLSAEEIESNWVNQVETIRQMSKMAEQEGAAPINIREVDSKGMEDFMLREDAADITFAEGTIRGLREIVKDPSSTTAEVNEAQEILDQYKKQKPVQQHLNMIKGDAANYGVMVPQFNEKGEIISYDLLLNKERSLEDGMLNTASHEFIHTAFYNTLKQDPAAQRVLGSQLLDVLQNDKDVSYTKKGMGIMNRRLKSYGNNWGEEAFGIGSELMADNDLKIKESGMNKLKGIFRRFAQNHLGRDIKFNTKQDVKNFMIDYHKSIANNKPSPAIARMVAKGAKGNLVEHARTPVERQRERDFSKAIQLNLNSNPDLLSEIDANVKNNDGTKKFANNEEFRNSNEFVNAYTQITSSKLLDGLIQQGMVAQGLPPAAMRDFTQKVKEKLGERFAKNYNIDKNDSLFGWLTGVSGGAGQSIIYRAKGDVMVQYTREQQAEQTSLDKPVGEGGTLADVLPAERSAEMEAFENLDLSAGRQDAYINGPVPVLNSLEMPGVKESVDIIVNKVQTNSNTKVDLDGLTYKGVKKLLTETKKVEKNGKMKAPTKAADVVPQGPLYKVLDAVAKHIGVDPKRILANQDLDAKQRKAAQQWLYSKIVKEDGSFDRTLLEEVFPEGETRSGEATGIANTKLGSLYEKGGRAKFAEGASAAGKPTQTKRTDVTMEELLGVFGINPDGSFQSGTGSDGAIRQAILSVAQLAGNQGLREHALINGTHAESVIAQLGDGRALRAFSKQSLPTIEEGWNDLINAVAATDLSKSQLKNAIEIVYGQNFKDKNKVLKVLEGDLKGFVELAPDIREAVESIVTMEAAPSTLTEHLQEAFESRQAELVLKNKLGFSGSVTDVFNSDIGQTRIRATITEVSGNMVNDLGVEQAGKNMIAAAKGFASAGAIGNGQLFTTDKPGGNIIPITEIVRSDRQNYQSTEGMADYIALLNNANVNPKFKAPNGKWIQPSKAKGFTYEVYNGKNWVPINTKLLAENVDAGLKDRDYNARLKQSLDARATSKYILDHAWNKVKSGDMTKKEFAAIMTQLGAGMESPLRRSANLTGIQQGIPDVIKRGKAAGKSMKDIVRYEHATSKQEINARIIDSYNSSGTLNDMNAVGYKTKQPGDVSLTRMFNPRILRHVFANANNIDLRDIGVVESINPKDRGTAKEFLGQDYVDAINSFVDIRNANAPSFQTLGKAIRSSRQFSKPAKGISVLDFDDTLATSNSQVISTSPDGKIRKLTAEQFAKEGADLLEQGWKHDFSEFSKVVDGKVASLFNKALKLQKKFGPNNMFVLTARPADSANSIYEFLKANGLNIPLKNITGLANSTPEAKALWIADKVGEGYNDFYFADDALQNVQAVQNMLDQFDVKSKVQQAKRQFSKTINETFNEILENSTGVEAEKIFSDAQAKLRGRKTKYKSIIPPSAQDFAGLLYNFLGKGKIGEKQMKFFKEALIDPFARGINELNASRQAAANDYKNLQKKFPKVKKIINKTIKGLDYTYDQAARVYLWNKAGFEVPGLSQRDLKALVETVESNPDLQAYAETVGKISKKEDGYTQPSDYWLAENITSDLLSDGSIGDVRADFLAEWQENVDQIFSKENLNKIQAIYGNNFREALEDMLYRMRTGRNRPTGGGRLMNGYMNWVNNSVGAIMFFNMRSALLQTISATNYINWGDNNPIKAAAAFANQPQYWKDFVRLFNSDFLKQRRAGNQRGINEAELTEAVAGSTNKAKAAIAWLLKKGFLPTQIADSFAIASGGATFFRNRINKYVKEGMTQEQAEKQAFLDFQETTEVAQQSAIPDMISQQQASPLGRLILSFQNTPMQYARIMNKAARDLVNGRGDFKTHLSKIAYYGFVQGIIFGSLQSALFAALGEDDEEEFDKKKERILNGMVDSVLSGIGYGGKAISTVKNTLMEYKKQKDKKWGSDHAYTLLQVLGFSPPIGSKLRKIYSSIQTERFNEDVFKKRGFTLDNPVWNAVGNVVEGVTNIPLGRMSNKMLNIDNALDANNEWWQRVALLMGWNTWDLGIKDKDIEQVKTEIKEEKKEKKKLEKVILKEEKKKEKEEENKSLIKENQEKSKKDGICAAINKHGKRCKSKAVNGGFCTVHEKKEQRTDGKKSQCNKIKSDGKRCKMQTSNKSGLCYYHD